MGRIKLIRLRVNKRVYVYIRVCKCILCQRKGGRKCDYISLNVFYLSKRISSLDQQ